MRCIMFCHRCFHFRLDFTSTFFRNSNQGTIEETFLLCSSIEIHLFRSKNSYIHKDRIKRISNFVKKLKKKLACFIKNMLREQKIPSSGSLAISFYFQRWSRQRINRTSLVEPPCALVLYCYTQANVPTLRTLDESPVFPWGHVGLFGTFFEGQNCFECL